MGPLLTRELLRNDSLLLSLVVVVGACGRSRRSGFLHSALFRDVCGVVGWLNSTEVPDLFGL